MNRKKVLNILYILLSVAVGITVFCFCMAFFHKADEENGSVTEESVGAEVAANESTVNETVTSEKLKEQGSLFDSLVHGSNLLKTEHLDIDGVKAVVYYLDNYEKKPLVLIQHGLTSKKEDVKDLAATVANLGYVVITPDAAGHGELKSDEEIYVIDMVKQTADNFEKVMNYFDESAYADVERTGFVGFSLGGLSSFYYAANGSYNPKVLVSLCSTPYFEDLIGTDAAYESYKNGKLSATKNKKEKEELEEEIRLNSPYEKLLSDTDTYFFMVCGDADDVVPHEGNVRFYEAMKDTSKDIRLIVKENQKHEVTEEDLMQVLEYLKGHL